MKAILAAAAVVLLLGSAAPGYGAGPPADREWTTYTAVNPLAAFYGLVEGWPVYGYPFFTGHEYGLAVSEGLLIERFVSIEGRFSIGEPNPLSVYTQLHLGCFLFVLDYLGLTEKGLYVGGFLKGADNYFRRTGIHYFNILPYVVLGYWLQISDFFIDLRVEQTAVVLTFSTAAHTGIGVDAMFSPLPGISPVMPAVVVNLGFVFR